MTYDELDRLARNQTEAENVANLKSLMLDQRFTGIVHLLNRAGEGFAAAGSAQNLAQHHGVLAHCMGSIYCVEYLKNRLRGLSAVEKS